MTIVPADQDSDGDGIPDSQDLCPTIPETYNGIQDTDGCPEIGTELSCVSSYTFPNTTLIVTPTTCNQCPCQYSDFANNLANNDEVRAVLRDSKKTIQYNFSTPWIVSFE